jgi:pyrroline-5-carboxylate reductase
LAGGTKIMIKTVGFIGYGSMGRMILSKYIEANKGITSSIYLANRTFSKIEDLNKTYPNLHLCHNNKDAARNADILFICVRPFDIKTVLLETADLLKNTVHIVSLNDSILLEHLGLICKNVKISKAIPSVTGEVNQSITAVCHNPLVDENGKKALYAILKTCGAVIEVPEKEIGLVSEMTGCMPGFISAIIDCFVNEALKHTSILNIEQISEIVLRTVYDTTAVLLEQKAGFRELISRVATKGGITEEGIKIIDSRFPQMVREILSRTLAKRKTTTEKISDEFRT